MTETAALNQELVAARDAFMHYREAHPGSDLLDQDGIGILWYTAFMAGIEHAMLRTVAEHVVEDESQEQAAPA